MTTSEFENIFLTYLGRKPTTSDWRSHSRKSEHELIEEIKGSPEYLKFTGFDPTDVTTKNSKIAILLSGNVRDLRVKEGLIQFCKNYPNTDVFVHAWEGQGKFKLGKHRRKIPIIDAKKVGNLIKDIPNLVNYQIESNEKLIEQKFKSRPKGTIYFNMSSPEWALKSQYYSVWKSFELCKEYAKQKDFKYDLVIRVRMDNEITGPFLNDQLLDYCNKYNMIFVANPDAGHHHQHDPGLGCTKCSKMFYDDQRKHPFAPHHGDHLNIICDILAYGSMKSMEHYCNLYNKMDEMWAEFSEYNLKIVEELKNIYINEDDIKGLIDWDEELQTYYVVDEYAAHHIFKCTFPEMLLKYYLKDYIVAYSRIFKVKASGL